MTTDQDHRFSETASSACKLFKNKPANGPSTSNFELEEISRNGNDEGIFLDDSSEDDGVVHEYEHGYNPVHPVQGVSKGMLVDCRWISFNIKVAISLLLLSAVFAISSSSWNEKPTTTTPTDPIKDEPTASVMSILSRETEKATKELSLQPDMSILPRRLYNIIGLESSGTHLVTGIIANALGFSQFREGSFGDNPIEAKDTQVVHYSLPWGSTCEIQPTVQTVDVVLPSQCVRTNSYPECQMLAKEAWGIDMHEKIKYPHRYNLDIISNTEFYERHNVEVFNIIVVRDPNISLSARVGARHCRNTTRALEEEEAGMAIIVDAINKYIINKDTDRLVTPETYPMWHVKEFQGHRNGLRRRLASDNKITSNGSIGVSSLPSGQNVVLVSYESMMMLQQVYVDLLYQTLGIESDYKPVLKDGNEKYVNH